jgi:E3 ubiquitin-protein ligase SHPRH
MEIHQLTSVVVTRALRQNGIKFASFDGNKTKDVVDNFIKDKSITVFLLHAERERSATHGFTRSWT